MEGFAVARERILRMMATSTALGGGLDQASVLVGALAAILSGIILQLVISGLRRRDERTTWLRDRRFDAHVDLLASLDAWQAQQAMGVQSERLPEEFYADLSRARLRVDVLGSGSSVAASRTAQLAIMEWAARGGASDANVDEDNQTEALRARDLYLAQVRAELGVPLNQFPDAGSC